MIDGIGQYVLLPSELQLAREASPYRVVARRTQGGQRQVLVKPARGRLRWLPASVVTPAPSESPALPGELALGFVS